MNPLLKQLEAKQGFRLDENNSISCLAFADDLILLADNDIKARQLLRLTESYFGQLGMKIAAEKCASFRITTMKDLWFLSNPNLRLSTGESIPSSHADDALRYLGGNISPWDGLQHGNLPDQLQQTLGQLKTALLKPHQKIALLSTYLIPHYLHSTVLATTPPTIIQKMDTMIRNCVKDILHLPTCTPNGLIYCRKRDGGMAIPKLETLVTSSALKQGIMLLNTTEPELKALFGRSRLDDRLGTIARAARLNWGNLDKNDLTRYKKRQKAEDLHQWSQLPSKGKSVPSFADDVYGNCWLYQPNLLKPSRYITALRLRSGTTGDRVTLHKAVAQPSVRCRRCNAQLETLAHVLGQCTHMKGLVIRRHYSIRDFI
jgi:hypothetical protein